VLARGRGGEAGRVHADGALWLAIRPQRLDMLAYELVRTATSFFQMAMYAGDQKKAVCRVHGVANCVTALSADVHGGRMLEGSIAPRARLAVLWFVCLWCCIVTKAGCKKRMLESNQSGPESESELLPMVRLSAVRECVGPVHSKGGATIASRVAHSTTRGSVVCGRHGRHTSVQK
jgi:hypothetical protein